MDDVGPVSGRRLGGVLGVVLDGGLRVVDLELDLLAEQPPRRVQLVDGHAGAIDHGLAVDVEPARLVEDAHELDGVGGLRPADDRGSGERRRGGGRAGEKSPAGYGHGCCSCVNSRDGDSSEAAPRTYETCLLASRLLADPWSAVPVEASYVSFRKTVCKLDSPVTLGAPREVQRGCGCRPTRRGGRSAERGRPVRVGHAGPPGSRRSEATTPGKARAKTRFNCKDAGAARIPVARRDASAIRRREARAPATRRRRAGHPSLPDSGPDSVPPPLSGSPPSRPPSSGAVRPRTPPPTLIPTSSPSFRTAGS